MAKKNVQIKCSCGEEFTLPKKMKGAFECSCGERYGVNEEPQKEIVVAPQPYVYPYRPYWRPWYGASGVTYRNGPSVNSGGTSANLTFTDFNKITARGNL